MEIFHKWGKWSEVITAYTGSLHQFAKCETCGKIKRRCVVNIMSSQLEANHVNAVLKERT